MLTECSEGVYEAGPRSTLVVFVHDFGNLRVETDGVATSNISMTNSYLVCSIIVFQYSADDW